MSMLSRGSANMEILGGVVLGVAVNMMHNLGDAQKATDCGLRSKPMCKG